MRAQDVMSRPVVTVTPGTSAKHAARLLSEHTFTALPVVDDDDRLIGIVTEADLIGERFQQDPRCAPEERVRVAPGATVGDVMSTPAQAMSPATDLTELARELLDTRIRAMPIVEGSRVVGIVTRGDIVRMFAREDAEIATDVRRHLAVYGGSDRWSVDVHDGVVHIVDEFDSETDRHVATVLAEAVPGVVSATAESRNREKIR
ncbi:CBS domain-containing protein [Amycolatopsis alkalitolerans]|uniref:CBS domain-containing protein n=1 Tax=Amycolatopsis alkalitolerans TaxID=2547244 RepID=A0A5C4LV74_9PSEU|nr:CBS domain-containing protein [Amycolatopsis alkalitolerans]TNC19629.1 CBS domain-containing protein [Amycolatopsis alkalitolerans]